MSLTERDAARIDELWDVLARAGVLPGCGPRLRLVALHYARERVLAGRVAVDETGGGLPSQLVEVELGIVGDGCVSDGDGYCGQHAEGDPACTIDAIEEPSEVGRG